MGTFRLYAGTDQQAHIEKIELKAKPDWLKGIPANQITFREWPVGQFIDWHPAPRRQFSSSFSPDSSRSALATARSTCSVRATRDSSKTRRARDTPRACSATRSA